MPASATLDPCGRAPSLPGGYGEAGPPSAAVPVEVEGAAASAMNPRPAPVAGVLHSTVDVLSSEARHPFGAGYHRVQNPAEMLGERTAGAWGATPAATMSGSDTPRVPRCFGIIVGSVGAHPMWKARTSSLR